MSIKIYQGDVLDRLRDLPPDHFHTVVTSPPYFGLRDYGVEGQIGLEETPAHFLAKMVEVFDEVKRVLRPDGTLWLNMGDAYAGSWGAQARGAEYNGNLKGKGPGTMNARQIAAANMPGVTGKGSMKKTPGLKPKDMMGMPWRLAFALQDAGWYLRQDIIWAKPNPMPESVADRCTKAHEYIFLMSKSARYYYDAFAIREELAEKTLTTFGTTRKENGGGSLVKSDNWKETERKPKQWKQPAGWDASVGEGGHGTIHKEGRRKKGDNGVGWGHGTDKEERGRGRVKTSSGNKERKPGTARGCPEGSGSNVCGSVPWEGTGANKRSVWTVATQPFSEAHFATFPPKLIEPCILAGSPEGGLVLDPFFGAGTTGLVADRLGRHAVGIELNPAYVDIAHKRLTKDAGMFHTVEIIR